MFAAIGLQVERLAQAWLLPCGALGGVIVGAWLVEAKQSVIENMAPVLTRLFTPLLRGHGSFFMLERWQTAYLPVYAVWAGLVVVFFPPLFGYF